MSRLNTRGQMAQFKLKAAKPRQALAVVAPTPDSAVGRGVAKALAGIWIVVVIIGLLLALVFSTGCNTLLPPTAPSPTVTDNAVYWGIPAPNCSPRPAPDLNGLRFAYDRQTGIEREVGYYDPINGWHVYGQFLQHGGRWLLCFWDTRG